MSQEQWPIYLPGPGRAGPGLLFGGLKFSCMMYLTPIKIPWDPGSPLAIMQTAAFYQVIPALLCFLRGCAYVKQALNQEFSLGGGGGGGGCIPHEPPRRDQIMLERGAIQVLKTQDF